MRSSFFAAAASAAFAALLAFAPAELAAARGGPGGGGGMFRHGGFGGGHTMFRAGGFAGRGGFRHSTLGRSSFRSSHSLRTASFHTMHSSHRPALHSRVAMHSRMGTRHIRLSAASRHSRLSTTPAGFSRGKAGWKQNGGTPPGWSHGNKTGWGCTAGSAGCMPPGLAKKNGTGIQTAGRPSPSSTASRLNLTPASTRRPMSGTRAPSASMKHPTALHRQPVSQTRKLPTPSSQ